MGQVSAWGGVNDGSWLVARPPPRSPMQKTQLWLVKARLKVLHMQLFLSPFGGGFVGGGAQGSSSGWLVTFTTKTICNIICIADLMENKHKPGDVARNVPRKRGHLGMTSTATTNQPHNKAARARVIAVQRCGVRAAQICPPVMCAILHTRTTAGTKNLAVASRQLPPAIAPHAPRSTLHTAAAKFP